MSSSERTLSGVSMGRIRSKTSVVCDAGPIIHLDELECLHLMEDFERVFVPVKLNNLTACPFTRTEVGRSFLAEGRNK